MKRVALALSLFFVAPTASAQTDEARAAARQLAQEGGRLFLDGDYAGAAAKLERAHDIVRLPTVSFWLAKSKEELGHWVEATELYREVALLPLPDVAPAVHQKAKDDAAMSLAALEPRLPRLHIELKGVPLDTVELRLDGKAIPAAVVATALPVDPGEHHLVAVQGNKATAETFVAEEGETASVVFALEPVEVAPPPPPPPSPTPVAPPPEPPVPVETSTSTYAMVGYAALGLGGAGAILAAVTGGLLLAEDASLDDRCFEGRCTADASDDLEAMAPLRPLTTVGIVVGAVGVATGVTLLLVDPGDGEEVAVTVSPTALGLRGRF